ncbi:ATP-dependent zinc protease family protein [Schleiferia thermophila]|jgi:hypothetical protein|uniref:ATP-dependent zinc protease family protein n=1 Tax=Schleiferia thermophila TaxID=884107 RepID=UPI0004E6FF05|nr:RimK/LysX family protein [Schleiferia thermophila]KFD40007.1 hypothetical protein AT05_01075 [Schleiferia thermophila str. Yellowstone]PMB36328.1 peptidase [Fischerella thermalis CCMEE 5319]
MEKKVINKPKERPIYLIGASDHIDLPEFNVFDLACRIDTGAATSALHCHNVELHTINGKPAISFMLLDPEHPYYQNKKYYSFEFFEKVIKNSFGQTEKRYSIKTTIVLFGKKFKTEITLADREKMKFPLLLGRKLLRRGFLVDVRQKDLSYRLKYKNFSNLP